MKSYPVSNCFCCPHGRTRLNFNLKTCLIFKNEMFCEKSLRVTHMIADARMYMSETNPIWDEIPDFCELEDIDSVDEEAK